MIQFLCDDTTFFFFEKYRYMRSKLETWNPKKKEHAMKSGMCINKEVIDE